MNPFTYGAVVTGIGLLVVFSGMCILIGMLYLMAGVFKAIDRNNKKKAAKAVSPAPAPVTEPVSVAQEETEPQEDMGEIIAVIAAAIAAFDGDNKSLVIKSVRRVSGWKNAARSEQVYKF